MLIETTLTRFLLSLAAIAFGGWLSLLDDRLIACIGLVFIVCGAINANFYLTVLWSFLKAQRLLKRMLRNGK